LRSRYYIVKWRWKGVIRNCFWLVLLNGYSLSVKQKAETEP